MMKQTLLAIGMAMVLGFPPVALAESTRVSPPLALAKTFKDHLDMTDYWVSEKMDGARAYWDGKRLLSRSGLIFHAPDWFIQGFPDQPLDGELWMGRGSFEELMHVVRDRHPNDAGWRQVRYWVFDLPKAQGDFSERHLRLKQLSQQVGADFIRWVEHRRLAEQSELELILQQVISAGGEGLMLQKHDLSYRSGRHAGLLKFKPFADAEATVLDYLPGKGKYQGLVGALLVEDSLGRRFKLGSGLSDAQRRQPPAIGSSVSYRYQGRTGRGLPRFARFLRIRPSE